MGSEWFHTFFEQDYFRKEPGQIGTIVDDSVPQVEFLMDVLQMSPNHRILDLCCGFGRHAISLARKRHDIVGFDLCERALKLAGQVARRENLKIHLVRGDARALAFRSEFDSAYSLFAFGYFENDDENLSILDGVFRILRPKGKFLLDVINGPRILREFVERDRQEEAERYILQERAYDKETKRLRSKWTFVYKGAEETSEHMIDIRLYSADELVSMLDSVGLRTRDIYGDAEKTKYDEDSKRITIVAEKR